LKTVEYFEKAFLGKMFQTKIIGVEKLNFYSLITSVIDLGWRRQSQVKIKSNFKNKSYFLWQNNNLIADVRSFSKHYNKVIFHYFSNYK